MNCPKKIYFVSTATTKKMVTTTQKTILTNAVAVAYYSEVASSTPVTNATWAYAANDIVAQFGSKEPAPTGV
jgi:hypothetical protein